MLIPTSFTLLIKCNKREYLCPSIQSFLFILSWEQSIEQSIDNFASFFPLLQPFPLLLLLLSEDEDDCAECEQVLHELENIDEEVDMYGESFITLVSIDLELIFISCLISSVEVVIIMVFHLNLTLQIIKSLSQRRFRLEELNSLREWETFCT